jgi:Ca2+-binding RTX toxin-like protein
MSTPTVRKGRRRAWVGLASLAGVVAGFLTFGAGSAFAATITCTYDPATLVATVAITATGDATVAISKGGNQEILVNGTACGAATALNTDEVQVVGRDAEDDNVVIDLRNGRFVPGAPPANNGVFFAIYLGTGDTVPPGNDGDSVTVEGTEAADTMLVAQDITDGDIWINTYGNVADTSYDIGIDADVSVPALTFNGNGGDDFMSGKADPNAVALAGDGAVDAIPATVTPPASGADLDFVATPRPPLHVDATWNGGAGDDEIIGAAFIPAPTVVVGQNTGNDTIIGGSGLNVLDGNSNTTADASCWENETEGVYTPFLVGGDLVDLSDQAGPLTITYNADGTVKIVGLASGNVAVAFEHVIASAGDDTITGSSGSNWLGGAGGNDTIDGLAGNDAIAGGDGDDKLAGGLGNDCVLGQAGDADILNENAPLNADGTPAYGVLGNGADALSGGSGLNDVIDYGSRTNRTVVNLGVISWINDGADPNADSVTEECDDVYFDTENAISGSGNDLLSADYLNNQSDNEFTDDGGNDSIEGGAGNDILHTGAAANGADTFEGDAGADLADYAQRTNAVTVTLDGVSNDGEAGEGDNIGGIVTNFGPAGAAVLGVANQVNVAWHTLFTCGQNLQGRQAQGIGSGDLTPDFRGEFEPFAGSEAEDVTFDTVENVDAGSGNDTLVGSKNANVLNGNAGNDFLNGNEGTDVLNGADGDDTVQGGAGNDAVNGGAGTDVADYLTAAGPVVANLNTGTTSGQGNDTLADIENLYGSPFNDTLRGNANANVINGRQGNDTIQGNGGDDLINGGSGNDGLNGGSGNDLINGQVGADALNGNSGDDTLAGGPQKDNMDGGRGTDRCIPGKPGFGNGDVATRCEA